MRMSFAALDRLAEEKMRTGRPLLSTARSLSDEELLEKLLPLSGDLDREIFRQMAVSHMSAKEKEKSIKVDGTGRFDAEWP